jgi:hypothetical protein
MLFTTETELDYLNHSLLRKNRVERGTLQQLIDKEITHYCFSYK